MRHFFEIFEEQNKVRGFPYFRLASSLALSPLYYDHQNFRTLTSSFFTFHEQIVAMRSHDFRSG